MSKITVLVNKEKRNTVFSEKYYARLREFGDLNILTVTIFRIWTM